MEENVSNISLPSFEDEHFNEIYVNIYVIDVVLLITNIIGLTANVIILCVIYKTKSWKTPIYALISNWAIMDILHLLTSPGLLKWYTRIHEIYRDFTLQTIYICLNVAFEFGIILILFVLIYMDTIKLFKKHCLKILAFIWSVVAVFCICAFLGTVDHAFHMSLLFSLALYTILVIIMIITCVTFIVKKKYLDKDIKLTLTMVCIYICFGLSFGFAVAMVTIFGRNFVLAREIVLLIFAMGEIDAVVNIYVLTKFNRIFNVYFYRLFDCRRQKHNDSVNIVYEYQAEEED